MGSSPRLLDDALLREFESRLREAGAPVTRALRPGLSDDEMDALTARLDISLPGEARRWWGWHDGATAQPGFEPPPLGPHPSFSFFPLARAVEITTSIRTVLRQAWESMGYEAFGPHWQPAWLLLTDPERPIVLDCGGGADDPVPVRTFAFQEPEAGTRIRSLGELVRIWVFAFDSGAWRYERDNDEWAYDDTNLEPGIAQLGLT